MLRGRAAREIYRRRDRPLVRGGSLRFSKVCCRDSLCSCFGGLPPRRCATRFSRAHERASVVGQLVYRRGLFVLASGSVIYAVCGERVGDDALGGVWLPSPMGVISAVDVLYPPASVGVRDRCHRGGNVGGDSGSKREHRLVHGVQCTAYAEDEDVQLGPQRDA